MNKLNTKPIKNIKTALECFGVSPTIVAKKSKGLVTQSTLSKLLNDEEKANPTIKTIVGVATAINISPWMLLIDDFPFRAIDKPINNISAESYALLDAFQVASSETKMMMMKQLAYFLFNHDNNKKESGKLHDALTRYQVSLENNNKNK